MSNSKLEIFDYLADYLVAANDICKGDAGANCTDKDNNDNLAVYIQSKYSETENKAGSYGDEVTFDFQQRVKALAANLLTYDAPTSTGTVVQLVKQRVNAWAKTAQRFKTADNVEGLRMDILTGTMDDAALKAKVVSIVKGMAPQAANAAGLVAAVNGAGANVGDALSRAHLTTIKSTVLAAVNTAAAADARNAANAFDATWKVVLDALNVPGVNEARAKARINLAFSIPTEAPAAGQDANQTAATAVKPAEEFNAMLTANQVPLLANYLLNKNGGRANIGGPAGPVVGDAESPEGDILPKITADKRAELETKLKENLAAARFEVSLNMLNDEISQRVYPQINAKIDVFKNSVFDVKYTMANLVPNNKSSQNIRSVITKLAKGTVEPAQLKLFVAFFDIRKGNDRVIPDNYRDIDLNKLEDYRINIKKSKDELGFPEIEKLIPAWGTQQAPVNKEYLEKSGAVVERSGMYLREQFRMAFSKQPAFAIPADLKPQQRFNMTKFVRDMVANSSNDPTWGSPDVDENDEDSIDMKLREVGWSRAGPKKFVKTTSDGQTVVYEPGNKDYDNYLRPDAKCFTAQVDASAADCADYMQQVAEGDSGALLKFIRSDSFKWSKAAEEIRNIYPALALQTLKSFGFKSKWNESERRYVIPPFKVWLDRLAAGRFKDQDDAVTKQNVKTITDKEDLVQYLTLLCQYVNAHPSLLNPGLSDVKGMSGSLQVPDKYKARKLVAAKPSKYNRATSLLSLEKVLSAQQKTFGSFYRGFDPAKGLETPYGTDLTLNAVLPTAGALAGQQGGQRGGGGVMDNVKSTLRSQNSSEMFKSLTNLLNNLKNKGLPLSENETGVLRDKILKYETLEVEILQTIEKLVKLNKYVKLVEPNMPEHTMTMGEINRYVSKYNKLMNKRETTHFSWIQLKSLLQDLVEEKNSNKDSGLVPLNF